MPLPFRSRSPCNNLATHRPRSPLAPLRRVGRSPGSHHGHGCPLTNIQIPIGEQYRRIAEESHPDYESDYTIFGGSSSDLEYGEEPPSEPEDRFQHLADDDGNSTLSDEGNESLSVCSRNVGASDESLSSGDHYNYPRLISGSIRDSRYTGNPSPSILGESSSTTSVCTLPGCQVEEHDERQMYRARFERMFENQLRREQLGEYSAHQPESINDYSNPPVHMSRDNGSRNRVNRYTLNEIFSHRDLGTSFNDHSNPHVRNGRPAWIRENVGYRSPHAPATAQNRVSPFSTQHPLYDTHLTQLYPANTLFYTYNLPHQIPVQTHAIPPLSRQRAHGSTYDNTRFTQTRLHMPPHDPHIINSFGVQYTPGHSSSHPCFSMPLYGSPYLYTSFPSPYNR